MKPYKTAYEVENAISAIEQETREFFDLEDNWCDDVYPESIRELKKQLERAKTETTYYMILDKIEECFMEEAKWFIEWQKENEEELKNM